jgi:hypothetical protein
MVGDVVDRNIANGDVAGFGIETGASAAVGSEVIGAIVGFGSAVICLSPFQISE